MTYQVLVTDPCSQARRGRLQTRRGAIDTPVFMPVGTQGTVKATSPAELREIGAQIILGNTYHLFLRPGLEVIEHFHGLHRFMGWDRPILTDSGGFQVFSLARLRRIEEEGVHFSSHIDGRPCFLSPEIAMEMQTALGTDIAMVFDECPPYPCEREYAEASLERTLRWARRCRNWVDRADPCRRPLVFGIVQGSVYPELRERSARELVGQAFDGYAVGGVSVGEPEPAMMRAIEQSVPFLPEDQPRYAMGLGTPPQIVEMVARGIDMFDCVLPTRLARNGTAFTAQGTLNLKNRPFRTDERPIEVGCACATCRNFNRGYIRHLIKAEEILGLRLITIHNLHFYLNLMAQIRAALENGVFPQFRERFVANYAPHVPATDAGLPMGADARLRDGTSGAMAGTCGSSPSCEPG
ncbi:MAG: tRNA guanosine(34) transglycosylase Tgt [Verrucomicrobia bacterium]|nr:tRNA guanosine(34) transglycosylase Tgt [Verrucomicrobiota bacterium]